MAIPTSRSEFKASVLRRIGDGAIQINVTDAQVEDRIDEALRYYQDYHYDGSQQVYLKYQITETDHTNRYISMPQNLTGVVRVFNFAGTWSSAASMFSIDYQIALNQMHTLTSTQMLPYVATRMNLELIAEVLVGEIPIRYNRHQNRLFIDGSWSRIPPGTFIIVEGYQAIDPIENPDVWGDRWLLRYTHALVEEQWGRNLSKMVGVSLLGGVQFNGDQILVRAIEERVKLEEEMLNNYSIPPADMIG